MPKPRRKTIKRHNELLANAVAGANGCVIYRMTHSFHVIALITFNQHIEPLPSRATLRLCTQEASHGRRT